MKNNDEEAIIAVIANLLAENKCMEALQLCKEIELLEKTHGNKRLFSMDSIYRKRYLDYRKAATIGFIGEKYIMAKQLFIKGDTRNALTHFQEVGKFIVVHTDFLGFDKDVLSNFAQDFYLQYPSEVPIAELMSFREKIIEIVKISFTDEFEQTVVTMFMESVVAVAVLNNQNN